MIIPTKTKIINIDFCAMIKYHNSGRMVHKNHPQNGLRNLANLHILRHQKVAPHTPPNDPERIRFPRLHPQQ